MTKTLQQPIKSYVLRTGRITASQRHALDANWQHYGLELGADIKQSFAKAQPLIVEIGFGNGEALLASALNNPEQNYLGIEVHTPGVGHLLHELSARQIDNVRVYKHDAVEVLKQDIGNSSLQGVHIFFPDPWHKKRHHKRRLVNPEFIELLAAKLAVGGYVHFASDWQDYAASALQLFSANSKFNNMSAAGGFSERPASRVETKFERRGLRLGHGVWDLLFMRQ